MYNLYDFNDGITASLNIVLKNGECILVVVKGKMAVVHL